MSKTFWTELTPAKLRLLLEYEPETGALTWKPRWPELFPGTPTAAALHCRRWNARFAGKPAINYLSPLGYREGAVGSLNAKAHRIAFAIHHGRWPSGGIDHINGDPGDNRAVNLREATQAQNSKNAKKQRGTSSRFKGVCWHKQAMKWLASIHADGQRHSLGLFADEEDAARAYDLAASQLHGEFASPNFPSPPSGSGIGY